MNLRNLEKAYYNQNLRGEPKLNLEINLLDKVSIEDFLSFSCHGSVTADTFTSSLVLRPRTVGRYLGRARSYQGSPFVA